MRIGELSQRSGVAIPTIKYYLREGLLAPGLAKAANQAAYGDGHLRRLRLIRALIDVGGVSVASARDVLEAIDGDQAEPHDLLGVAHEAVAPRRKPDRSSAEWAEARNRAEQFAAGRNWLVHCEAVGFDLLADILVALESLQVTEVLANLDRYADTAEELARLEVAAVLARDGTDNMLELVVLGTVLGESLFSALRLLAHQHESAIRLRPEPESSG